MQCESSGVELPVMQLGVPQQSIGEMMDTLTPLPSHQCMFCYSLNVLLMDWHSVVNVGS